jgi:YesN/AraC family two-component response regulator
MAGLLRSAGHAIDTAADGKTGLSLYRAKLHSLVISDIVMPDMDGIELIEELRQTDPRPRVIAISGG